MLLNCLELAGLSATIFEFFFFNLLFHKVFIISLLY